MHENKKRNKSSPRGKIKQQAHTPTQQLSQINISQNMNLFDFTNQEGTAQLPPDAMAILNHEYFNANLRDWLLKMPDLRNLDVQETVSFGIVLHQLRVMVDAMTKALPNPYMATNRNLNNLPQNPIMEKSNSNPQ